MNIMDVKALFTKFKEELEALAKTHGQMSPEYQAKLQESVDALSSKGGSVFAAVVESSAALAKVAAKEKAKYIISEEGDKHVKSTDKFILTYESKSHGKRRYFVSDPGHNPKQDGKPAWSYEKKDAKVLDGNQTKTVKFYLALQGYGNVEAVKVGPSLTVINGGKVEETPKE